MSQYILIAEDDQDIAELLLDVLTVEGYAVEIVTEGTDVIPAIHKHRPNLIILDINLPKMNGNDVMVALKILGFVDIPVIFSTAVPSPEQYRALGPVAILPKPYGLEELLDSVAKYIR